MEAVISVYMEDLYGWDVYCWDIYGALAAVKQLMRWLE